jgi:hypothetical protein
MSHEFHEPEENEIAGPVVLALVIVAVIVISIALM